jgi:hypothetical protein
VADGDGGVGIAVQQQVRQGTPHQVRASQDHRTRSFDLDALGAAQHFHDAGGRGRDEALGPGHQAARVFGMKAVHVLCGVEGVDDLRLIDVVRQRELHENAVHVGGAVEARERVQQLLFRDCPGVEAERFGADADLGGGFFLAAHVGGRGGAAVGQNHAQARRVVALVGVVGDRLGHLLAHGGGEGAPVDSLRAGGSV